MVERGLKAARPLETRSNTYTKRIAHRGWLAFDTLRGRPRDAVNIGSRAVAESFNE